MASQQHNRHRERQPLEEWMRLELQGIAGTRANIDIEVHDHDGIRGGIIVVNLKTVLSNREMEGLRQELANAAKRNIPEDHPLATWSLVIRMNGEDTFTSHWFEE